MQSIMRKRNTIMINETPERNQVCAEPADIDFVLGYIEARLPKNAVRKQIKTKAHFGEC